MRFFKIELKLYSIENGILTSNPAVLYHKKSNTKKGTNLSEVPIYGDRDRIRTCDRLLRRQMLYPAELRDQYAISVCQIRLLRRQVLYPAELCDRIANH